LNYPARRFGPLLLEKNVSFVYLVMKFSITYLNQREIKSLENWEYYIISNSQLM